MKRNLSHICLVLCLLLVLTLMLFHADLVIAGAHIGLELWYESVLPSIFPFMIITTLLLNHMQGSNLCVLGLVCGLPVGANLVNQQYASGTLSAKQANMLLTICNITSPMFICGYIWNQSFHKAISLLRFLFLIYLPILVYGLLCYIFNKKEGHRQNRAQKQAEGYHFSSHMLSEKNLAEQKEPQKSLSLESILLHCLKVIFLVGIYIMLFCILIQFILNYMPSNWNYAGITASILEITNGIQLIQQSTLSLQQKTALIAGLTSFGGICSIFQTKSVLTESELSITHYTVIKLMLGSASYLLGIFIPM